MCGIAGYLGSVAPSADRVARTLTRMNNRGPDARGQVRLADERVCLLHTRLAILDLDRRSNQPFEAEGCWLVFNGEIYNYLELRAALERRGHRFHTTSDTEVLLRSYLADGPDCVRDFEGMWAFAIWDSRSNALLLSRDRFGEKPLVTTTRPDGFYFASETGILAELTSHRPPVNRRQLARYLVQGYKSLRKNHETFFEGVCDFPAGCTMTIGLDGRSTVARYWSPTFAVEPDMTLAEAVAGTKARLLESVKIRLRSDVPLAFCLSGGVDSAALVSIAAKEFGCRAATFSIIDDDPRYNELDSIQATVADTGVEPHFIAIPRDESLERLRALIRYHDAPIATITYFVHSLMSERLARGGFRVVFSGTSADELVTGYYDHFLLHLAEVAGTPAHAAALAGFETHTATFVRNPVFKNPRLYLDDPRFRDHVYDHTAEFAGHLRGPQPEQFHEAIYCQSLLRNRMLNELLHEATPVILHEDDLNSMFHSVENRSPYLDSRLVAFAYSIPARHLIHDGHAKHVLREAVTGLLNDEVRLDRRKRGFNASINSLVDLRDSGFQAWLLDRDSPLADLIDVEAVRPLLALDPAPNHYSKFLFNLINVRIFCDFRV
jgi:asparagine synthase (glutamine-hydrolysing)